jgi:(S)-citramalyl-CoA lyase
MSNTFTRLRTALFVPGTRPERFAKALASGADAVIVDLEDAVERHLKDEARGNMQRYAREHPEASFMVRVNDASTSWFADDIAACRDLPNVTTVILPKAESAEQVRLAAAAGKPLFPVVESARGVHVLDELAAMPGVQRLSFGALDLLLDLGVATDTEAAAVVLDHLRVRVLILSRLHGLSAPLDTVYPDFSNTRGLAAAARRACDMGFEGMLCIHPAQVAVVHEAYAPAPQELDWARRVVAQAEASGSSAFKLDGKMVDAPVIIRARKILERAG